MAMSTHLARAGWWRLERLRLLGTFLQRVERQQQERGVKSEESSSKSEEQGSKAVQPVQAVARPATSGAAAAAAWTRL